MPSRSYKPPKQRYAHSLLPALSPITSVHETKVVGYLRVSTDEQRQEGVSLDVQRQRIVDYCKVSNLNLIALYSDEHSGRNLSRPGLKAALSKVVETKAMLVAVSLDRISRSVLDWGYLLTAYFDREAAYSFLTFDCAGINPKTATGETHILWRAVMAQGEVAQTRERTLNALNYLRAQGVHCGGLPYGKAYSPQVDEHGRRIIVEVPEQMATVDRITELHKTGLGVKTIASILQMEGRPTLKGRPWNHGLVRKILERAGLLSIKHYDRTDAIRDEDIVTRRIAELRALKLSYKAIGVQLTREKLMPRLGSRWHAQTVRALWEEVATYDPARAREVASGLYRANYSLRKIGAELSLRGLTPPAGGVWHSAQVRLLLTTELR